MLTKVRQCHYIIPINNKNNLSYILKHKLGGMKMMFLIRKAMDPIVEILNITIMKKSENPKWEILDTNAVIVYRLGHLDVMLQCLVLFRLRGSLHELVDDLLHAVLQFLWRIFLLLYLGFLVDERLLLAVFHHCSCVDLLLHGKSVWNTNQNKNRQSFSRCETTSPYRASRTISRILILVNNKD